MGFGSLASIFELGYRDFQILRRLQGGCSWNVCGCTRQNLQESINLLLRVEAAEADPQQAASLIGIVPHSEQDAGGFSGMIRVAGAACGDGDSSIVQCV